MRHSHIFLMSKVKLTKQFLSKAKKRQSSLAVFEKKYVPDLSNKSAIIVGSKLYEGSTDRRPRYKHAVGIDFQDGDGVDIVMDLCKPDRQISATHVDCLSVLEHCYNPFKAAETITDMVNYGGSLLVSVPFMWREHGYPSDYFRFSMDGVKQLFPAFHWMHICYMAEGAEVPRIPALDTKFGTMYAKTEVYAYGIKK